MVLAAEMQAAAKRGIKRKGQEGGLNPSKQLIRDVPNCRLYANMRELELRIDQYINRKKAEICDVTQPAAIETRQLRLYVYNQHSNQGCPTDSSKPASWSLYIYGHFVEAGQTVMPPVGPSAAGKKLNRWTEAMQSIEIRIDEQGEGARIPEVVRWDRDRHTGFHRECVEVHRTGSTPTNVQITMVRNFAPEYFHVQGALAMLLSTPRATRGKILTQVWHFVKAHSVPDKEDPSFVVCDAQLKAIFHTERLELSTVSERVQAFLRPCDPVVLHYAVKLEGSSPSAADCYDVEVGVPLKEAALKLPMFLDRLAKDRDIQTCNEEISRNMKSMQDCHRRFTFLSGFAAGPVQFMQNLVAAATKEVHVHHSNGEVEHKQMSSSDHYKLPWAQDAVVQYLQRGQATGRM